MNEETVTLETEIPLTTEQATGEQQVEPNEADAAEVEAHTETADEKAERFEREANAKQKRIDRLTREKYQREGREQERETRLQQLEKQAALNPVSLPGRDQFESDEAFIAFTAREQAKSYFDDMVRKENETRADFEQRKAEEKLNVDHYKRIDSAIKRLPDFDKVMKSDAAQVDVSGPAVNAIKESPLSADILYTLAKDADMAEDFAIMTPTQQVKFIGKLEAKLEATPIKTRSSAPDPITPINGKSSVSSPTDRDSIEEWTRKRNAQLRK
jgi:hypothetical protein